MRVHEWRETVDAILIGSRTAMEDDPKLTVRLPEGREPKRIPTRIVVDSGGTLSVFSELALTARDVPLLLVFGPNTPKGKKEFWESKGCLVHESYSLVPKNDKSLLLIAAGMAPLKPYFAGTEEPPIRRRSASGEAEPSRRGIRRSAPDSGRQMVAFI